MKFFLRNNIVYLFALFFAVFSFFASSSCHRTERKIDKYQDSTLSIQKRVDDLIKRMTLEEKIGQLTQLYVDVVNDSIVNEINQGKVGSVLNGLDVFYTREDRNKMQKAAVDNSRLGIPLLFGHDVVHGFQTIFPLSIAQSCTWSPDMIEEAARIAALEASSAGVDWTFAPMIDVSRDARWGRVAECYGEDPMLNSIYGASVVRGFQGNDVSSQGKMIACLKHFVGYSAAVGGRDYQYTGISDRDMHEIYLKPFEAGVNAGAMTVMSAFNDINGVPATANRKYIGDQLKKDWGFEGFVVSDWDAVVQLIDHGIAQDTIEAATKALLAGLDMEMKSRTYASFLKTHHDKELLQAIDDAVRRILWVKVKKGLFENPYINSAEINQKLFKEHRNFARNIAGHSFVLLKNDKNVLPIGDDRNEIAVVGPFANEKNLMGWWKSVGNPDDVVSPIQGLKQNTENMFDVLDVITPKTDVIVLCLGETREMFGEYHSRASIELPEEQIELLKSLQKYQKPIVTIIFNGRPLALQNVIENSDAVLLAWHPGTEAGNALADVLYGKHNPSGKLTMSFPKSVGQVPIYYNHRNSGRPHQSNYIDLDAEPLFPFGYGLSYTKFEYSKLSISDTLMNSSDSLKVSVTIGNIGNEDGYEVAQLYIQDRAGSTTRPVKELKSFKKVMIKKGDSAKLEFVIHARDLKVYDNEFNLKNEPGEYFVWIAPNSESGNHVGFRLLD